ncbi:hypothetical protein KAR91_49275 [Candidatus Pacearchaeota archaeon]|nr:hypothetical protein [Candidatus Pacearchaeota archaeon]
MPTDDGLKVCGNCQFYKKKCSNPNSFFCDTVLPIDMTCNNFGRGNKNNDQGES